MSQEFNSLLLTKILKRAITNKYSTYYIPDCRSLGGGGASASVETKAIATINNAVFFILN